ncbi:ABC transporter ATP-binding protein [Vibrio sp. TH_r3]|uniref:ABC transporter ATP-binding protein n=1 Tax=unclassified Vibrio TaxID=2614977 RepID=UPI002953B854|nr:ABC transporter ATP-binding protein [Vibrio sp. TH_r3]MDV7104771.1 ABC transporter ATP-binding protein [Vibrio sp. TH_r3]
MDDNTLINLSNISLNYKNEQQLVFSELNMPITQNQWTCILGKSGCGKTSLLRFLAGLLDDQINWSGTMHTNLSGHISQHVAYMAQQDLLLPWLNVVDNVCLSFQFANRQLSQSTKQKAIKLIEQVGLLDHIHQFPDQLSGGMRQRVALARTLMQDKPLVLMDEPFSALDAVTRYQLQNLAAHMLKNKTVLLITHDPQEALRLGDHIALMQGKPASACTFPTPSNPPPRMLNGEIAALQQKLIEQLEKDHV